MIKHIYIRGCLHYGGNLALKNCKLLYTSIALTMERPVFKKLFKNIEADEIDIVVVHKVVRLTRLLMNFYKLVEILDKYNALFVPDTQHFNTTTSMDRLTLKYFITFP